MSALRALDRQPARTLNGESLSVSIPIDLVSDTIAARALPLADEPATRDTAVAPPLLWFSRVVYSADRRWALVYAAEVCPGVTQAMADEAENGAYERVLLVPLQWREEAWTGHDPLYLDVGLPRLERH
jgi:hypothetical protein